VSEGAIVQTWDLFIPERGSRRPFRSILDRPERIRVAWHRDAKGIHKLLDTDGKHNGLALCEPLWEIREYERVIAYDLSAYYELIEGGRLMHPGTPAISSEVGFCDWVTVPSSGDREAA
jgi:hypothetical protein